MVQPAAVPVLRSAQEPAGLLQACRGGGAGLVGPLIY